MFRSLLLVTFSQLRDQNMTISLYPKHQQSIRQPPGSGGPQTTRAKKGCVRKKTKKLANIFFSGDNMYSHDVPNDVDLFNSKNIQVA